MSKLYNDSDPLSMELMKKYREGTLSAEEEARLHELQAQDPFVADALEGMTEAAGTDTFAEDVDALRSRIKQRTGTKKSLSIYWLPVAASLVLLIGAFYVAYTFVLSSDSSQLMSKEVAPSAAEPEVTTNSPSGLSPISLLPPEDLADTPSVQSSEPPQSLALVQLPTRESEFSERVSQELPAGRSAESVEEPQTLSEVETEAFSLTKQLPATEEEQKPSSVSYGIIRSKKRTSSPAKEAKEGWRVISGQVVDRDSKNPIPGVNILVKDTIIGTVTDVNGRFSLSVPENYKGLQISTIGYTSSEVEINQQDSVYVAMAPDMQMLSEVVVVGYGVQEKRDMTGSVSIVGEKEIDQESNTTSAHPREGMRAFKQYLSEHQRYPDSWQEGDKAVVKLSFFVGPNGKLSNITIEKSAGAWPDQEAIRLLKEGPAWEPATRNGQAVGQEVKLRVRFKK